MFDDVDELELIVVFVITLVGMGKLNKSFDVDGLRGISSSFVSNGLRLALGPCCAPVPLLLVLLPLPKGDVLVIGLLEPAIADNCCFCRYASALRSLLDNGNGGDFDKFALVDDVAAVFVPNALYIEFKYDE